MDASVHFLKPINEGFALMTFRLLMILVNFLETVCGPEGTPEEL